jgi:hypothetical protein
VSALLDEKKVTIKNGETAVTFVTFWVGIVAGVSAQGIAASSPQRSEDYSQ